MARSYRVLLLKLFLLSKLFLASTNNIEEVQGKTVIITGAAQSIGYATADIFLQNGAKVVIIIDIDQEKGIQAYNTLSSKYGRRSVEFINCDVTECLDTTFHYLINKYQTIDLLINNAGIGNEADPRRTVDVNVLAVMEWTYRYLEHMRKDKNGKGGAIINISSIYGFRIDQFGPVYKGTKFAVLGFSKTLGYPVNFAQHGVRILTVCPGFTNTTMLQTSMAGSEDYREFVLSQPIQEAEAVGQANLEVYKNAASGTAWLIEGGEVTEV